MRSPILFETISTELLSGLKYAEHLLVVPRADAVVLIIVLIVVLILHFRVYTLNQILNK